MWVGVLKTVYFFSIIENGSFRSVHICAKN